MSDRSERPVAKSQGVIEERDDKAGKVSQDEILAAYHHAVQGLRDRVEAMEVDAEERLSLLEQSVAMVQSDHKHLGQAWNEVDDRQNKLEERLAALEAKLNCEHEPICLPSSRGPVPILAVQIADARKMDIVAPGQPPPIAFAIAMCKKCGLPYVFINTLKETAPLEGGPSPVPLVKPGEPVGGTGDLGGGQ